MIDPLARSFDKNGHLIVSQANISKAAINPYLGREIPKWKKLGLDADRTYKLLRDPDEIKKAVNTFNGKPLLFEHKPAFAHDHDRGLVVGTLDNVAFDGSFLKADLHVWTQDAIDAIESGDQKELSSSYHYDAAMQPGTFEGQAYDGRMTNIAGNHLALVKKGRAGPECVVGDAALLSFQEVFDMSKGKQAARTAAASVAHGALLVYARPKLAQDAKLDLSPVIAKITKANFKASKPALIADFKKALEGKLAKDADISDVGDLVDALDDVVEAAQEAKVEITDAGDPPADDDDNADVKAFLAGKLSDEDIAKVLAMIGDAPAVDEDQKKADAAKIAADAKKGMVSQTAMDSAIRTATEAERTAQKNLREAERFVRPWVGDIIAQDTAEAVYRTALTTLGIKDVDKKHADSLRDILDAQPKPGDKPSARVAVAQDAAKTKEFETMFPNANRLK